MRVEGLYLVNLLLLAPPTACTGSKGTWLADPVPASAVSLPATARLPPTLPLLAQLEMRELAGRDTLVETLSADGLHGQTRSD